MLNMKTKINCNKSKVSNIYCGLIVFILFILDTKRCLGETETDDDMHPDLTYRTKRSTLNNDLENSNYFWTTSAQIKLRDQILKQPNLNIAKNVIFFLGDGMSIPTIAASRIYLGQLEGKTGEGSSLFFEDFPYIGLAKTYCVDKQVADSACSATAYLAGVKANYRTIGVTAAVKCNDCNASNNHYNHVSSIATWAQNAGKGTGIVTTTRVTHASPAGTYAHVGNREWECDADVLSHKQDPKICKDIASQLIYNKPGKDFKVIYGGGRQKFLPANVLDEDGELGNRLDGIDLIKVWQKNKNENRTYIHNKNGLESLDYENIDSVLGLFSSEHMRFHLDNDDNCTEPTLKEMTISAIKILEKEPKGYFLFVEGGKIDMAHHKLMAHKALDETVQLSEAIKAAVELTKREDTLIIVTADHAHTMSISGYSDRGTNILGLNTKISKIDHLPYTTLSYANGPVNATNQTREDLNNLKMEEDPGYKYPAMTPLNSETHGGDDVGVFALGPQSHLFCGVYEQNVIPHILAYASCIGEGLTVCKKMT